MTTKNRRNLLHSLPFVSRALGEKMGVNVVFGRGHTACTDGKTIYLPQLPEDDNEAKVLARGYIDHESAHVRHTDFDVSLDRAKNPVKGQLINLLEDIRIEQLQGARWPGCKDNLNELISLLGSQGAFSLPEEGDIPPVGALLGWLSTKGRLEILQQTGIQAAYEDHQETVEEIFCDPQFLQDMSDQLDRVGQSSSTQDISDLADQMLHIMQNWLDKNPPPPEQPQPSPDASDQDSSDPSQSEDSNSGGESSDDGSESEDSQGQDSEENSSGDGSGSGDSQGQDSEESSSGDGSGSGDSQGQDSEENSSGDGSGSGDSQGQDSEENSSEDGSGSGDSQEQNSDEDSSDKGSGNASENSQEGASEDAQGGDGAGDGPAQKMRRALEEVLQSDGLEDVNAADIGELIKEKLDDLSDQLTDNLTQREKEITLLGEESLSKETSASWGSLVDLSDIKKTSVQLRGRLAGLIQAHQRKISNPKRIGRRIDRRYLTRIACKDPRVFQKTQDRVEINTAVAILLDRSSSMCGAEMRIASQSTLACVLALESINGVAVSAAAFPSHERDCAVVSLTRFEETSRQTVANYGLQASGGTPLADAVWRTTYQLMQRREPRKIMIVVTDGQPNHRPSAQFAVQQAGFVGIECMGVGIFTDAVEGLFPEHCVIQTLQELPPAMFGMLQSKLLAA